MSERCHQLANRTRGICSAAVQALGTLLRVVDLELESVLHAREITGATASAALSMRSGAFPSQG